MNDQWQPITFESPELYDLVLLGPDEPIIGFRVADNEWADRDGVSIPVPDFTHWQPLED